MRATGVEKRQLIDQNVGSEGRGADLTTLAVMIKGGTKTYFARDKRQMVEEAYRYGPELTFAFTLVQ